MIVRVLYTSVFKKEKPVNYFETMASPVSMLSDSDESNGETSPKSRAQQVYELSIKKKMKLFNIENEVRTNVSNGNAADPVVAPLSSLFDNLNLNKLELDGIDIDSLCNRVTPSILSKFLNKNGFCFAPSLFESIPQKQLQSMLDNTGLSLYLHRKLEKPKHRYSLSYFVQENYFNSINNKNNNTNNKKEHQISEDNIIVEIDDGDHDEKQSNNIDLDKYISPTANRSNDNNSNDNNSSSVLSPTNFTKPHSNHSVSSLSSTSKLLQSQRKSNGKIRAKTAYPGQTSKESSPSSTKQFAVSSALSSSSKPPENTDMLRNILKGIKGAMTTRNSKNPYINSENGDININDDQLKQECKHSSILKVPNGEFEFEEYSHKVFEILRGFKAFDLKGFKYLYKLFGIELINKKQTNNGNMNGHKKNTVDIEYATKHFWKSLITNSKSGQLFYRSRDDLFIIKALKYDEWVFLRNSFLFHYYKHMETNIDSLLAKILGVYRINDIYIMVMKNVHHSMVDAQIGSIIMHKVYDLKGSTHKRQATRHKLLLDRHDYNAMNNMEDVVESTKQPLTLMEGDEDEEQINELINEEVEETIDNIRHRYSPSWYTPTKNEDSSKIKIIKSDTLISPKKRSSKTRNAFTFDAAFDDEEYDENATIMSSRNKKHRNNKKKNKTKHKHKRKHRANTEIKSNDDYDDEDDDYNDKSMRRYSSVEVWKRSKILKDLDWIQDEQIIKIGKIRTSFFLGQLDKDLKFLIKMNVMDYSLLIGIHFRKEIKYESNDARWTMGKLFRYENGGMCYDRSEEKHDTINTIKHKEVHIPQKDAIYFTGIIDFLQVYTSKKKIETFVKGLATDKNKISSIDPDSYAKRLYSFIEKCTQ